MYTGVLRVVGDTQGQTTIIEHTKSQDEAARIYSDTVAQKSAAGYVPCPNFNPKYGVENKGDWCGRLSSIAYALSRLAL